MTCKDCIHEKCCRIWEPNEKYFEKADENNCTAFQNKADFVEVPCKCGECKYATKHYRVNHLFDGWWHTNGEYELLYITCPNSNQEKLAENDFCSYGTPKERGGEK